MKYTSMQEIGQVSYGIDGTDVYYNLTTEEPVALPTLKAQLRRDYAYDSRHPGGVFCSGVTVLAKPYNDLEYVVIVHNRYDC